MITTRNNIRHLISAVIATTTIAIASIAFQANSVASSGAEELSTDERARLERQLAIAREERDALVLENKAKITELTEALESERAALSALRDELEAAKTALTEAEAEGEEREHLQQQLATVREEQDALELETKARITELTETLERKRAELATRGGELEAAESLQADAEAKIAELTEALESERAAMAALSEKLELAQLGGRLTEKGILVNFDPDEFSFASASAVLSTTNLPTLDRIIATLEDRPELSVRIEGHTDSLGSPEINQPLSQQRAEAVRQALIERGLAGERVEAHGAGSTQPIADNATPEGQRRNRRVELYLISVQDDEASAAGDAGN